MLKLNVTGLDKIKQRLEEFKKPENIYKLTVERICEKVPEARAYADKFKFKPLPDSKFEISADGIPSEIYAKIKKALTQQ